MMHGAEKTMALGDGRRSLTRDALDVEVTALAVRLIVQGLSLIHISEPTRPY